MITKEQFYSIQFNKGKFYFVNWHKNEVVEQDYLKATLFCDIDNEVVHFRNNDNELIWKIKLDNLFETKEEAEFILKNHTSKTLYFRPPTFLEFLKTRREGIYAHWYCGDICIVMEEDNQQKGILRSTNTFRVDDGNNYESFKYEYDDLFDNRKEVYEKAVEYAKKLFLGEVEK